jgi:hypothetical protein
MSASRCTVRGVAGRRPRRPGRHGLRRATARRSRRRGPGRRPPTRGARLPSWQRTVPALRLPDPRTNEASRGIGWHGAPQGWDGRTTASGTPGWRGPPWGGWVAVPCACARFPAARPIRACPGEATGTGRQPDPMQSAACGFEHTTARSAPDRAARPCGRVLSTDDPAHGNAWDFSAVVGHRMRNGSRPPRGPRPDGIIAAAGALRRGAGVGRCSRSSPRTCRYGSSGRPGSSTRAMQPTTHARAAGNTDPAGTAAVTGSARVAGRSRESASGSSATRAADRTSHEACSARNRGRTTGVPRAAESLSPPAPGP